MSNRIFADSPLESQHFQQGPTGCLTRLRKLTPRGALLRLWPGALAPYSVTMGDERAMGFFDWLRGNPKMRELAALEDFMDRRTAFLVQKCVYEYSRARSGLLSSKLFKEPAFLAAIEATRWRNYPLCLESVALMAEHALRPAAGMEAQAMRSGLIAAVGRLCSRYPVPTGFEPDFWANAQTRIARRIALAGMAAPRPVKDFPHEISREFFANMPIHASLRSYDFQLITNNLRVNLCRAYDDLLGEADLPALARLLIESGSEVRDEASDPPGVAG